MKRRQFVKSTAMAATASLLPVESLFSKQFVDMPYLQDIGLQLFSVPHLLEQDFDRGIELLAQMGFKKLELFGPYPFSADEAKARWTELAPRLGFSGSGYFGHSATSLKTLLDSHSLSVPAIHTDLISLENHMEGIAASRDVLGFDYAILPALPAENRVSMDDYKQTAELFNKIGKNAREQGLRFAYHNHGYGLMELEGVIPMQYLIENTDPDWVYFEMDLFWTTAGNADPLEYLEKYPGRYRLMHVKDMKEKRTFSGDGGDPGQWMELFPMMCSAGDGVLDLKSIIPKAQESGVEHFIVEHDLVKEPELALPKSIDYLNSI